MEQVCHSALLMSATEKRLHAQSIAAQMALAKPQDLPFSVKVVCDHHALNKVTQLRAKAYAAQYPELGKQLQFPEEIDLDPDVCIFIAESKETGEALGTIRLDLNVSGPISLERSVVLPSSMSSQLCTGVSRLAIKHKPHGKLVQITLFKAIYIYCINHNVEWMLIGALPPLDKTYLNLGFTDVYTDQQPRPLIMAGGMAARILSFSVFHCESSWRKASHRYYPFFFETRHRDINVSA